MCCEKSRSCSGAKFNVSRRALQRSCVVACRNRTVGSYFAGIAGGVSWRLARKRPVFRGSGCSHLSSMAALALYEKAIERWTRLWPSAWHLVVAADDKCRAEHIERIRRSCERKRLSGKDVLTDYSEQKPWSACFRLAAADTAFWDEQVRHPAAAWVAAGSRGAPYEKVAALHLPGGQPALEPQVEGSRADRRRQREVTKHRRVAAAQELQQLRAWKQARADTGGSSEGSPNKVAGRGNSLEDERRQGDLLQLERQAGQVRRRGSRQAVSVGQGARLPEVPQRRAPVGGVPAVGLGSAATPIGVQGDGAASCSCPNAEEDYNEVEAQSLEEKFNSQGGRPAEGSEQVQPLVSVGRFGNVLVRQQLAELSWKGSRGWQVRAVGTADQEGPEGGGERQVHRGHARSSQGGPVGPRLAARRLDGDGRVSVLCQVAPRSAGGSGPLGTEGLRGPDEGVDRAVEACPSSCRGRQGQVRASGLRAVAVPL